jgi:hypothetical protein
MTCVLNMYDESTGRWAAGLRRQARRFGVAEIPPQLLNLVEQVPDLVGGERDESLW